MKSKTKKGLFVVLPLMATLALVAAACSHDSSSSSDLKVGLVYDIGGRGDQSFNDSAYAGLSRAGDDLGVNFNDVSPNADGTNRAQLIDLQSETQDVVIGVGFLFGDSILAAANANPDVKYGIIDGGPGGESPDNLAHLLFAEHEGSFLVGVAAGLKTTTNNIGFIGGVNFPLIQRFEAGFVAGVAAVNAAATVTVRYVTEPPDFDGFNDPAQARVIANNLYSQGNDIIYHAAGGSGAGLFEEARAYSEEMGTKVWAIGVDSDQYNTVDASQRDFILTSMLKRVDTAVYSIIEDAENGTFSGGNTPVIYDLSVDGVGYSTSGGFVDDIVDQLEDWKARIVSGAVTVPDTP